MRSAALWDVPRARKRAALIHRLLAQRGLPAPRSTLERALLGLTAEVEAHAEAAEGDGAGEAEAEAEAAPAPPVAARSLSERYGRGASAHTEETLEQWREAGVAATDAARRREWEAAVTHFETCVALRPDWEKNRQCLERARQKAQAAAASSADAAAAVETEAAASSQLAAPAPPAVGRQPSKAKLMALRSAALAERQASGEAGDDT